jgi:Ser/Thr protein kinase RdoA (MazF antagonist)
MAAMPSAAVLQALNTVLAELGVRARQSRCVARLSCEIHRVALATPLPRSGHPALGELALRIYPAQRTDPAPIAAEMAWLADLAGRGLHTPAPLARPGGGWIHRWQPDPAQPPRQAVLLAWLPGRLLDRGLRPLHLRRVGELTAQLHRSAETLRQQGRLPEGEDGDGPDLPRWADPARARHPWLAPGTAPRLVQAARGLQPALAALPRSAAHFGWIHADLHLWNLLFHQGRAGAIDFSDCGLGHHAQDMASVLQYLRFPWVGNVDRSAEHPRLRDELLAGYASARPLPDQVLHQIELYTLARMITTVEWMVDQWPAPDHRPWGPGFLARMPTALDALMAGL